MSAAAWLDTDLHAPGPLADIEAAGLASRPGMSMIGVRGARLRARVQMVPERPTVILLPDGPNTIEQYDPIFDQLRGQVSVVAFDPPGYGFSYASSPDALGFEGAVAALSEAIKQLDLGQLILTGPCANAYLAIGLAAALRPRVLGVVAAQATDLASERAWVARAVDPQGFLRTPIVGQMTWGRPQVRQALAVDAWYQAACGPGFDTAPWREIAGWTIRCGCSNALASVCQLWFDSAPIAIPVVDSPAVILWGAADRTHRRSDPAGLKAYLPRADLRIVPEAGHFPDLEAPRIFAEAILDFAALAPGA